MTADLKHHHVQSSTELKQEELGRLVTECMKVMGELTRLNDQNTQLLEEKQRIAHSLNFGGVAFDHGDMEMRRRNVLGFYGDESAPPRTLRGPSTSVSRTLRSIGAAFHCNPTFLEGPFNTFRGQFRPASYPSVTPT